MNAILKIISYVGLGLTIVPSLLLLAGFPSAQHTLLATVGMMLWFATAPFWVNKPQT